MLMERVMGFAEQDDAIARRSGLGRIAKRQLRVLAVPMFFLSITGFFGWSATQGNRGLVAYAQSQDLLRQVQADNAAARAERDGWERRVAGLRASHLNPDTLDERVRAMLNLADPTDVVVQYAPKDKLF
jgi:cell division protein FtsB